MERIDPKKWCIDFLEYRKWRKYWTHWKRAGFNFFSVKKMLTKLDYFTQFLFTSEIFSGQLNNNWQTNWFSIVQFKFVEHYHSMSRKYNKSGRHTINFCIWMSTLFDKNWNQSLVLNKKIENWFWTSLLANLDIKIIFI